MVSKITVNGVSITTTGRGNLVIVNGRVLVDGKDVTPDAKHISIEVNGDAASIQADSCDQISVRGRVLGDVATQSGDVRCGNVAGSVQTMSGDVTCGTVSGRVTTMSGDVRHE